jgi:four helix bundle protein
MTTTPKPRIRSHRDLIVWQKALELSEETYRLTEGYPKREIYGISAQMRSASTSVPGNIAEGHGRRTTGDYVRFLAIANGSLRELDTYLDLSKRRKYITDLELEQMRAKVEEIGRMLAGLCKALRRKQVA